MIKSVSFRKTMMLVLASVFLYAAVMLGVYSIVAPRVFATSKMRELMPRAQFLAEQAALHFASSNPADIARLGIDTRQWGASIYVYDERPAMLASTEQHLGQLAYPIDYATYDAFLLEVLSGKEMAGLQRMPLTVSGQQNFVDLLVIGLPIFMEGNVAGALIMMQSLEEIISATSSLLATLWFSMLAVLAAILPFTYLYSRRITLPLREMRDVALRMAAGDFAIRGNDMDRSEIGDLARALNHISSELGKTIADLTHERNRALAIINALDEGIWAVDSNLRTTQTNPAMQAILITAGNGRVLPLPPEVWADFRLSMAEGHSVIRTFLFGGLSLHLTVTPVDVPRPGITSAIGVFHDTTQAHRLEETRRDYVANVSHELRTPLTALRAMIEPLRDGLIRTEEKRKETYDIILRETMRLSRLVDDMLELSRLQRGRLALEKIRFAIAPLLHDTASIYAAKAATTGHVLELEISDEPLPTVLCNPDRTEQVLVALLNNAFTYTPPGSRIVVRAEPLPEYLRVIVEDSGPGIAEEHFPYVFDRFYKVDKSHSGTGGTGLGLAIARELMEKLGEEIAVENCETGGARFWFTLHYE